MQLTNLLGLCLLGLASTAAAMPRFSGPYHGTRIAVHVPANSTGVNNATTTGTRGKTPLSTGSPSNKNGTDSQHAPSKHVPNTHHVPNHIKQINHCNELCSLGAQTCTIAMPEYDKYW